jgi:hypothetical protein
MADDLTGRDSVVVIGTDPSDVELRTVEFRYGKRADVATGRAAGDRGTGRTYLGSDWAFVGRAKVNPDDPVPNLFGLVGANSAFSGKTDATPHFQVAGDGMVTDVNLVAPVGDYVLYDITIESDDPDAANQPTVTVAS